MAADKGSNGSLLIPKWFLIAASLILTGAVPWATFMSVKVASIETKVSSIRRDIDRNERNIENIRNTRPEKDK